METIKPAWLAWDETQALIQALGDTPFRFVGGAVRDALLARPVRDVDLATPLPPQEVMQTLEAAGIKAVPTGIDHGTVTAVVGKKHFEITTLRRDVATDGRRAVVAYTSDWKEDASRRDFTMNALYCDARGEVFDYFGGAEDARAGRVRFIGEPLDRIREDALRILRFFRFFAHYGTEMDVTGLAACGTRARDIEGLSGERIDMEMMKLLVARNAADVVILMQQYNVWKYVVPHKVGVQTLRALPALLRAQDRAPDALLGLAALLRSIREDEVRGVVIEAVADRWKLSKARHHRLRDLCDAGTTARLRGGEKEWKRCIRAQGAASLFADCIVLMMAEGMDEETGRRALALARDWQAPAFPVTGDDLLARGFQGKELGETLKRLEADWEAEDYAPGREALLARLK